MMPNVKDGRIILSIDESSTEVLDAIFLLLRSLVGQALLVVTVWHWSSKSSKMFFFRSRITWRLHLSTPCALVSLGRRTICADSHTSNRNTPQGGLRSSHRCRADRCGALWLWPWLSGGAWALFCCSSLSCLSPDFSRSPEDDRRGPAGLTTAGRDGNCQRMSESLQERYLRAV